MKLVVAGALSFATVACACAPASLPPVAEPSPVAVLDRDPDVRPPTPNPDASPAKPSTAFESLDATPKFWRAGLGIAPVMKPVPSELLDRPGTDPKLGVRCSAKSTRDNYFYVAFRVRQSDRVATTGATLTKVGEAALWTVPALDLTDATVEAALFTSATQGFREVEHVPIEMASPAAWTFTGKAFSGTCTPHDPELAKKQLATELASIDELLAQRRDAVIDLRQPDFGMKFQTGATLFRTESEIDPRPHPGAQIEKAIIRAASWVGWADARVRRRVELLEASDRDLFERFAQAWDAAWATAIAPRSPLKVGNGTLTVDSWTCGPESGDPKRTRCTAVFGGAPRTDASGRADWYLNIEVLARDFAWDSMGSPRLYDGAIKGDIRLPAPRADARLLMRVLVPGRPREEAVFVRLP